MNSVNAASLALSEPGACRIADAGSPSIASMPLVFSPKDDLQVSALQPECLLTCSDVQTPKFVWINCAPLVFVSLPGYWFRRSYIAKPICWKRTSSTTRNVRCAELEPKVLTTSSCTARLPLSSWRRYASQIHSAPGRPSHSSGYLRGQ
jgi:hypothetical protein